VTDSEQSKQLSDAESWLKFRDEFGKCFGYWDFRQSIGDIMTGALWQLENKGAINWKDLYNMIIDVRGTDKTA